MGSSAGKDDEKIPCLEFSKEMLRLKEGSEEWKEMCKKVREACESYGCFILMCDEIIIPKVLIEEMFVGLKELFGLPEETKRKHISTKAFSSYTSECPTIPLSQSFGIVDAHLFDSAQAFTSLMWPQGNPSFCEKVKSLSSKMLELSFKIMKMILESYGLPKQYTMDIESMKSSSNFRMMKYKFPESDKNCETGLLPHTDKSALTILCQNEVQGLQVLNKISYKWIQLNIPQQSFVIIVGDILKAWSNGRLHAATHRVMMSSGANNNKERYSIGLFAVPREEVKIEVPNELVDNKMNPLHYHPFNYGNYFDYFVSTLNENALDEFAGV